MIYVITFKANPDRGYIQKLEKLFRYNLFVF